MKRVWLVIFGFAVIQFIMVFAWHPAYLVYDELLYKELSLDILILRPLQSYMYPPLYPIMILPGFIMGNYFYEGILMANIVGKTIGLYIIYRLLVRVVNRRKALLTLLMIAFSPIYFIYSRYILAENLFAPMLVITILYYIVYGKEILENGKVSKNRKICLTCGAAALALGLFWTKYLAIILFPVLCMYWSGIFKRERKELKGGVLQAILYTAFVVLALLGYGILSAQIHNEIFNIHYLKQTLGFGFGSGPEVTGYRIFPEFKWIVCYLLYAFLCAVFPIAICTAGDNKRKTKNLVYDIGFIVFIEAALIFVAARHSSFVSYNANEVMLKLIGRYVSYSGVLFLIIWAISNGEEKFAKKKYIKAISISITLVISYLVLYREVIWIPEENWLDGIRGVEQIIFTDYGTMFVCISCIVICLIIGLYKRYQVIAIGLVVVMFGSCDYYALMTTYNHNKELIDYTLEMKAFLDTYGNKDALLLCDNPGNYSYAKQRRDFYRLEDKDYDLAIMPIMYMTDGTLIEIMKENIYIELLANEIDTEVYNTAGIDTSKTIIFLNWDEDIFTLENFEYSVLKKENSQIEVKYRDTGKNILVYGDYIVNPVLRDGDYSVATISTDLVKNNSQIRFFDLYNLTCSEYIKVESEKKKEGV